MASPSPSSPPALQTGAAQQQSTARYALIRDCDGLIDVTSSTRMAEAFLLERTAPKLLTLTRQLARLNPYASGIGAGMLLQHVTTVARRAP